MCPIRKSPQGILIQAAKSRCHFFPLRVCVVEWKWVKANRLFENGALAVNGSVYTSGIALRKFAEWETFTSMDTHYMCICVMCVFSPDGWFLVTRGKHPPCSAKPLRGSAGQVCCLVHCVWGPWWSLLPMDWHVLFIQPAHHGPVWLHVCTLILSAD